MKLDCPYLCGCQVCEAGHGGAGLAQPEEGANRALLSAATAVTGDAAFWREPMGAAATLDLVRHHAAGHRARLLGDREVTSAMRPLLEAFVRVGWSQAIEHAEQLDEMFV